MKRLFAVLIAVMLVFTIAGCSNTETSQGSGESNGEAGSSLAGRYVGYSWQGEVNGVELKDADQYIETLLELDDDGTILDAEMRFFVKMDGYWTMRQSGNAYVDVDFSVDPTPAVPGENYQPGNSMFTIYTADMMSFYAVAVDEDQTVAAVLVDPIARYQFEMKFAQDFDFSTPVGELTIGNGLSVPTVRTSSTGLLKPDDWEALADNNFLNISPWSHVINDRGVLENITEASSVKEFLEALGVEFEADAPQPLAVKYAYYGNGGWDGNYRAIESYLIGKDAKELTSLVDWSNPRYAAAINDNNQFGVDTASGATRTVQNSMDTISGATVRISREATSFQRALVQAGILDESDVIVGRF
ncbi:hypothetical protein CACET_c25070 [Clostridium aceticum]|uniref:Uncharacterized protein n=1 Tax=Clostridium aceticum TaxID=84022 RepID=A0A0D8IAM1_9CLOT|nr:hypothetical protein [Clostridium aceticum]AKL95952.1 hypothetical protein CACET_c25070 [Clostridium aceticum]KJF27099.1 hypothetical protein TZ02_09890 [Clostridium aceticum]